MSAMLWFFGYLLNALWQVPLIYLVGTLLVRIDRYDRPAFAHRVWVSALLLQILLPLASLSLFLHNLLFRLWAMFGRDAAAAQGTVQITFSSEVVRQLSFPAGFWPLVLVCPAFVATVYFASQLGWHLRHIGRLRSGAETLAIPGDLAYRFDLRRRDAGVSRARLALSAQVAGPVTIGSLRPLVLVPFGFDSITSAEDQDAAFAHELAHIRRHDYAKNLAYEVFSLPLALHPLRHRTLAQIAASREILCDALAAATLAGPERYARSLLRLATAVFSAPPAANPHAIGLCDAHTLERRIMSLTSKSARPSLGRRLLLATATITLTLATCLSAAALGLRADPQATQPIADTDAVHVASDVMAGQVVSRVDPTYPAEARTAKITGTVVLKAVIGKDGTIGDLSVISGPSELQRSAVDAVRHWVYRPYLLNGAPTAVQTTIHVNYQLAD